MAMTFSYSQQYETTISKVVSKELRYSIYYAHWMSTVFWDKVSIVHSALYNHRILTYM